MNMAAPSPTPIMVSVVMITYNHEKFIEQAIRSVIMQDVDFKYELIIGEDCSTDRTREIIVALQQQYPDIIRLVLRPQNVGMMENFIGVLKMAKGKYIALLEGDDYWIDKYKLIKQVQFLEKNSEYVLVCTNAIRFLQVEGRTDGLAQDTIEEFDFDNRTLMLRNPCPTLTVVFRNGLIKEFPPLYLSGMEGDLRLYMMLSQYGKCRFLPEFTAVYRVHPSSVMSKWRSSYKERKARLIYRIKAAENWNEYLGGGFDKEVETLRAGLSLSLVSVAVYNLDWDTAIKYSPDVDPSQLSSWGKVLSLYCLKTVQRIRVLLGYDRTV